MAEDDRTREVLQTLKYLFPPGRIIEIRAITEEGISSGYFSDYHKAAIDLLTRETDTHVSGIYVTLNEVNPTLLARRANRIKYRLGKKDASTADSDIIRRHWLPIDIDPIRPSGVSSSESEHTDALVRADSIATFLTDLGWPQPIYADSGNGAHLLYRIDLPNEENSRNLIRSILETLDNRFSDSRCKVDTANFNASRIWKVYGTISRKGDHLPDRPHRRSRILSLPEENNTLVSADQLRDLIESAPAKNGMAIIRPDQAVLAFHQGEQGNVIDLSSWLTQHGLSSTPKPYQGGTLYNLDSCPFSDAHTDGAFAIQFANGAIFAGCHHDSCGSGKQRWPELRARFERSSEDPGIRLANLRSDRLRQRNEAEGRTYRNESEFSKKTFSPDCISQVDDSLSDRARMLLFEGKPLSFLLDTFARSHEGDVQVAQCLIHSLISRTVINSKGLHVSISGESGKGKSHAIDTMRTLIPPESRIEGRVSDKALFYMEDLLPGTVITLDDVNLSDQMQEVLKGVTSSFQKPFPYCTVNKDRKPQVCTIPERCVWWIAKVEGAGDDQVFNRMLTCWIDDTEEQDRKVLDRALASAEQLPDSQSGVNENVQICRQMWKELSPVWVVIPFAQRIRFQSAENRRNPDMLLDLIRTHAGIHQFQRERQMVNGTVCVVATEEDFDQAARLFVALNGETGGQGSKLTKREFVLITALASCGNAEVTVAQLQRITGWTSSTICKLLHGYRSYGKLYSGLLEKCPSVSYLDRTTTKGDEGQTTMRHARVYQWDPQLYEAWAKGGSVWLAGDDEHGDSDDPSEPPAGDPILGEKPRAEEDEELVVVHSPSVVDQRLSQTTPQHRQKICSLTAIRSEDFTLISGFPDKSPCSVCGKKPTKYRSRMTPSSQNDADEAVLMLCASCYQRAVSREAAAVLPLPGVIHPENMIPLTVSVGRCHLCQLRPAKWSDTHNRTILCESCYQRELTQAGKENSITTHDMTLPDYPPDNEGG